MCDFMEKEHSVVDDFDELNNIKDDIYIPLSVVLLLLGFDVSHKDNIVYLAYIRDKFLNQPKYKFNTNEYKFTNNLNELNLSFSIKGFKKLSLIYHDAPRYFEILEYFINK